STPVTRGLMMTSRRGTIAPEATVLKTTSAMCGVFVSYTTGLSCDFSYRKCSVHAKPATTLTTINQAQTLLLRTQRLHRTNSRGMSGRSDSRDNTPHSDNQRGNQSGTNLD